MIRKLAELRREIAEALDTGDNDRLRRVTRQYLAAWREAFPS